MMTAIFVNSACVMQIDTLPAVDDSDSSQQSDNNRERRNQIIDLCALLTSKQAQFVFKSKELIDESNQLMGTSRQISQYIIPVLYQVVEDQLSHDQLEKIHKDLIYFARQFPENVFYKHDRSSTTESSDDDAMHDYERREQDAPVLIERVGKCGISIVTAIIFAAAATLIT